MSRKNRRITDLKYDSKRQIDSLKARTEALAAKWGDVDMFIAAEIEEVLGRFDEIKAEIDGVDPNTH